MDKPAVYLIPTLLGGSEVTRSIPTYNVEIIDNLWHFVVENEKSARRFIKKICPQKPQSELNIEILNKKTPIEEIPNLLQPLKEGHSIGILSEAGMPGIADPGAMLANAAHQKSWNVIPLVGPSSIFMALVASGFNGQQFSFNGYLPIDKRERIKAIQKLEQKSKSDHSAQIFMETPYRNNALLDDLLKILHPQTQLCVACDITLPSEMIWSGTAKDWKQKKTDLHKRPAIFIIQS